MNDIKKIENTQKIKWYFVEWMDYFSFGQHQVNKLTGWQKNKTNRLFHGKQPFNSDDIADLSRVFQIQPYELLLHPKIAISLRDTIYPMINSEKK